MLDLMAAFRARRVWKDHLAQQHAYAAPVDKTQLTSAARAIAPNIDTIIEQLHRDGVTVMEGYWPAARCAAAREEIERLIVDHPSSVRLFSNASDKRMFGAEMAGPSCSQFHNDPFLKSVGEIEGGFALYNLATLGARIDATSANRGSGDGWHRDAFGYQFKAIIYLNDVTNENGPFEYVPGSHTLWRVGLDSALGHFPVPPESRVERSQMTKLVDSGALKTKRFPAKAGTVILVNTTGVHGGAPLAAGTRYALTNYYYHPFQIGKSVVDKFRPLVPGVSERLAPFLEAEDAARRPD